MLLDKWADVNATDQEGLTILDDESAYGEVRSRIGKYGLVRQRYDGFAVLPLGEAPRGFSEAGVRSATGFWGEHASNGTTAA